MIHLSLVQTCRARFGLVVAFGALAWSCGDRHGLSAEPERPRFEVVAQERQLFLDDQGVSEIHRLRRTMHPPRKRGAVIRPDRPWETSLQTRCVPAWDEQEQRFKIWMITSTPTPEYGGTTYAESRDGITWSKPNLNQRAYQGSRQNNFLSFETNLMENVVYDPDDPDPARRFKGFFGALGRRPAVSADGKHWKKLDAKVIPSADESNLSYDRQQRQFIATLKGGGPFGRAQTLSTSRDFVTWSRPRLVFHADELDQELGAETIRARFADPLLQHPLSHDPEFYRVDVYNLAVFRYESLYIGLPAMFHSAGPSPDRANTDGFHHVQLICSRDLRHWQRLGQRRPFIGPSQTGNGAFDLTQLLPPSAPVLRDDELWFYYTGIKYRGIPADADPKMGAICLAVLRRDGFVSLDAEDLSGSVLTRPFRIPGKRLFVNVAAAEGELRAALVNASGEPIEGFGIDDCRPIRGDQQRVEVTWQGNPSLWPLTTRDVQLRFRMRRGSLYSYWFEEAVPRAPFLVIDEDFESSPRGSHPRLATTHVERKGDSIGVVEQGAAGGRRCLAVTDAEGVSARYNPHFFYEPRAREGTVRCRFDLRVGPGVEMYHAWRGEGGTGPRFFIREGRLESSGRTLMDLPQGDWVRIEVTAALGEAARGTWDLAVKPRGGPQRHFRELPMRDRQCKTLDWLGFVSNGVGDSVFYLDNIELIPLSQQE